MAFSPNEFMSAQSTGGYPEDTSTSTANGGWDGGFPVDDPSSSRLGTLVSGAIGGAVEGAVLGGLLNGSKGAKTGALVGAVAGIAFGGENPLQKLAGSVGSVLFGTGGTGANTPTSTAEDWRVKISIASATASKFYTGIAAPLASTGGVNFPTTPTVSVTHQANYSSTQLTHSNYKSYFYQGSDVPAINITGEFTAQTVQEANYVNACIHFLRACTKMFFGDTPLAGNPPPLVFVSGYGGYLPNAPCVVTTFSHTMPNDVDYINANGVWVPTLTSLTVSLQPVYSRQKQLTQFSNERYNSGMYSKNFPGGFI